MEILLLWGLCGLVGLWIASRKGISPLFGFLAGVFLGPLVFLMLFVSGSGFGEDRRPCPWCAEPIRVEAKVCKHCGRDAEAA